MSSGGITEFLNELDEKESLVALQEASSRKSPLIFKIENNDVTIKAFIESFSDKKVFLKIEPERTILPIEKEVSMKFLIGTEVYFIKTQFKVNMNRYYFDMNAKVIQLKRRKEPRHLIPKGWTNTAGIVLGNRPNQAIKCLVIDVSKSGVRFEVLDQIKPNLKRDDFIKIKFQVHKRGEVLTTAIVRFLLSRPNMNTLIGLEFTEISPVQGERVASIVGDIELFNSTQKS